MLMTMRFDDAMAIRPHRLTRPLVRSQPRTRPLVRLKIVEKLAVLLGVLHRKRFVRKSKPRIYCKDRFGIVRV